MQKQSPFVGQTVLFLPNTDDSVAKSNHNQDYIPAIITRVWSDTVVNLKIIPDCGSMQDRTSVSYIDSNPAGYHFKFIPEPIKEFISEESILVSFGNFMLKKHNVKNFNGDFEGVWHSDICNWKDLHKIS